MSVLAQIRAWASFVSNAIAIGGGAAAAWLLVAHGVRRWRERRA